MTAPPFPVLEHFAPHTRGLTWTRAPGGFSGAHVWRGDDHAPRVALKAWPPDTSPERLGQIHAWVRAAQHLPFVPNMLPGVGERTVFVSDGRAWDCCAFLPGSPRPAPTAEEVAAACEAVARLHTAWAELTPLLRGPCPGVHNRLRVLAENEPLLRAGPGALPPVSAPLDRLLRRAVEVAARAAPGAVEALRAWEHRAFQLQPCARDLRGEHVLFSTLTVTGIIDFGAAAIDYPAVDLARLLGDLADTEALFARGLSAYRAARSALDAPDELVRLLAQTGAVCSVLGWLVRLVVWREPITDPTTIAARLSLLVARSERFPHV